jgi:Putative collagen-binding domain of a collagenase
MTARIGPLVTNLSLTAFVAVDARGDDAKAGPAIGPLRMLTANPRYFTDGSGKAVYLTAAHTWANLQDIGFNDPPPAFDYDAHLDFLHEHHHNFIRLWRWELSRWTEGQDKRVRYCAPHPWRRAGPGAALDGKPKFDLYRLDPAYFDRLRFRVVAARGQGIFVSVMLFEGWGLSFASWDGHPFHVRNNVQGIDGDPDGDGKGTETQALVIPEVTRIQEAYVRKVIDTVNDLDNVLFEIANESLFDFSKDWHYHMIRYVKEYERTKPKQHPVGMTGYWRSDNRAMADSPADWVSPGGGPDTSEGGRYASNPPAADERKVIILDTDHIFGLGGGRDWAWKSFLRGYNPIWMDPYETPSVWVTVPGNAEVVRRSLGDMRRFAERMNLAAMTPRNDLASSRYCLAEPGREYLVYLPSAGKVTVDLSKAPGAFAAEWFHPGTGQTKKAEPVRGGSPAALDSPFREGDAVLYLKRTP